MVTHKRKRPVKKTLGSTLSAAEICRRNGWRRGTRIVGDEGQGPEIMRITAVGDYEILAFEEGTHSYEMPLDLYGCNWRKAGRG